MQNRWADDVSSTTPVSNPLSMPGRQFLLGQAERWCHGQSKASLLWRGALWLYLAFAGIKLVINPSSWDIFGFVTFVIHEIGHVLFGFLGEFMGIAGGSIAQLLAPLYALAVFWRQQDWFALTVGGYWLGSSVLNLSVYIGDARPQELDLIAPFSFGEEPIHDWHYLLTRLHLLQADTALSWMVRIEGALLLAASLAWGGWIMWRIAKK